MQFNKSKVEYASHQLSLYRGECPHKCSYCYVKNYRKRGWKWACGPLRINEKAEKLAREANENIECLVISFTSDPLPYSEDLEIMRKRLGYLIQILEILEKRQIPTKVLTKNSMISLLSYYVYPYDYIQIGVSITSNVRRYVDIRRYESHFSNSDRFDAIRRLQRKGFRTWVSLEPILPRTDIEALLKVLCWGKRFEEIWIGKPNYHKELIEAFHWPDVLALVKEKAKQNPQIRIKRELLTAN